MCAGQRHDGRQAFQQPSSAGQLPGRRNLRSAMHCGESARRNLRRFVKPPLHTQSVVYEKFDRTPWSISWSTTSGYLTRVIFLLSGKERAQSFLSCLRTGWKMI